MRTMTALLALGLAMSFGPAAFAGPYDGKWLSDIPAQGACRVTGTMILVVADDAISGEVQNPGVVHPLSGKLNADGSATFAVAHKWFGTMTFNGDHFDATWNNGACDRHASGDRALSEDQKTGLLVQRHQHQDAYAALIRSAEAGDNTVDYTLLRSEAVYAKDWDFYDQKTRGLLDQANAAVKGKDCAMGLQRLNAVIKLDFTIDAAHSLRAECLKDAGDNEGARIESDIARGLIHSLMDSGKGEREKNAYVVVSQREEMDVLANRHIQLKTRDTEVRGSDGHYYDVVHGISVQNGFAPSIEQRIVYFDVTSFMQGRASARAAIELAAAEAK
jgi:hypothetical protein